MTRVLLPEEITEEIISMVRVNQNVAYTNPDLCLELSFNNFYFYETIELKTTKGSSIPGSSVQQVIPNEWVIFIKHNNKGKYEIITGQYVHAVNTRMQFPDRSPRPQISFNELKNWNKKNRVISDQRLLYKYDQDQQLKLDLLHSWQDALAQRWVDILFSTTISYQNRETWFNNNLRKFILLFLDKYDVLTDLEKTTFKDQVASLITKN